MNKKIIALLLAVLLLAALCACGRKSESAATTEATTETDAAESTTAAGVPDPVKGEPDSAADIPTPQPTLNWVENDDGSMTATIQGENDTTGSVTMGVVEGENIEALDESAGASTPAESTSVPVPTTPPLEAPTEPQDPITDWTGPDTSTTLAEYNAMSGTEQTLFYYSFANDDEFLAWYNAAKAADDAGKNYIEIGENGIVNAG